MDGIIATPTLSTPFPTHPQPPAKPPPITMGPVGGLVVPPPAVGEEQRASGAGSAQPSLRPAGEAGPDLWTGRRPGCRIGLGVRSAGPRAPHTEVGVGAPPPPLSKNSQKALRLYLLNFSQKKARRFSSFWAFLCAFFESLIPTLRH